MRSLPGVPPEQLWLRCSWCWRPLDRRESEVPVEDVVAVEVRLGNGGRRYFLCWGRVLASTDPRPLENLITKHARIWLGDEQVVSCRVCLTLMEAATSGEAPYFYEGLLSFSVAIPYGDQYEAWRQERASELADGRGIYYCGSPDRPG